MLELRHICLSFCACCQFVLLYIELGVNIKHVELLVLCEFALKVLWEAVVV